MVPTYVFKAIYDPANGAAGAYVATNAKEARGMTYETISIADLEKRIGIVLFPRMPRSVKETAMKLPRPKPHGH